MEMNPLMKEISPDESVIWGGRPDKKAFVSKSLIVFSPPISGFCLPIDVCLFIDYICRSETFSFFRTTFSIIAFQVIPVLIFVFCVSAALLN